MRSWRLATAVVLASIAAAAAVYAPTLSHGFRYDDYFLFRPWSVQELVGVWTATWDPTGISVPFYRPLTSWWYAASFWALGVNAQALHAVSLAIHTACAVMVYAFLRRESLPPLTCGFGAALYAVHPSLVYAQAAWLTNQMHLLASLGVLASLLVWQRLRARPAAAWWVLVPLSAAVFLIKEDTVMLLPVLAVLTGLRRWWRERDVGPALLLLAVVALAIPAILIVSRRLLLGEIGGYGLPSATGAWDLYVRGLRSVLRILPSSRPWQDAAGACATAALVLLPLAAMAWRRTARGVYVGTSGLVLTLGFNLPFTLVSKVEQYHLLALGGVILIAGVADALWAALASRWGKTLLVGAFGFTLVSFGGLARHIAGDFEPCHPIMLDTDQLAKGWWLVPDEIEDFIDRKADDCRAGRPPGRLTDLPRITWGVYDVETDADAGVTFRWTTGQVTWLLGATTREVRVTLRDPRAHPGAPQHVAIVSGGVRREVVLTSGEWQDLSVPVQDRLAWLRGMARADLTVRRTFVPRDVDPASSDARRLGVQIHAEPR